MSTPVAVVTGAGGPTGIGFACARELALTHALVIAATSPRIDERVGELRRGGADAIGFIGDLRDSSEAQRLVDITIDRWGRIDVLINNAGMLSTTGSEEQAPADQTSDDQWRAVVSRNLDTNFFVTRAALTPMAQQGFGRIVNVGSVSGSVMAYRGDAAYHAAKAAVVGLTRSIALDYARHGITANVVAPGWIATGSATEHRIPWAPRHRSDGPGGPRRSRRLSPSSPPLGRRTSAGRCSLSMGPTPSPRSGHILLLQATESSADGGKCRGLSARLIRKSRDLACGRAPPVDEMVLTAEAELLRHIVVGKYLSERLHEFAVRHREIGALYGRGLYQGVDLVTADGSSTPLPARDVAAICERFRELGCIVASTGLHGNVLKAKPPLCIRRADINRYIAALDRVRTERAEFRTLASTAIGSSSTREVQ